MVPQCPHHAPTIGPLYVSTVLGRIDAPTNVAALRPLCDIHGSKPAHYFPTISTNRFGVGATVPECPYVAPTIGRNRFGVRGPGGTEYAPTMRPNCLGIKAMVPQCAHYVT